MSLVIVNMHSQECWVAHERHVNEAMKNSSKEVPDSLFIEIKHKKGWFSNTILKPCFWPQVYLNFKWM